MKYHAYTLCKHRKNEEAAIYELDLFNGFGSVEDAFRAIYEQRKAADVYAGWIEDENHGMVAMYNYTEPNGNARRVIF